MDKVTKLDLSTYYKMPNPSLLAYFRRAEQGSDVDIRPPFFEGQSRSEVSSSWFEVLENSDAVATVPGLLAFEEEMMSKIGPLSIQEPLVERVPKIVEYYKDITLPSQPIDDRAIKLFLDTVAPVKVQMRSIAKTLTRMKLSTNSGSPLFTKRAHVSSWELLEYQRRWREKVATLGWRGQEGGPEPDDVKQRTLFMFPFYYNIQELQFYQPLIEAWQHYDINSAYISMRAVEVKITNLFDTKGDDFVVVSDFKGFDQHFNNDLQTAARKCIEYQIVDKENWLGTIFPIKYEIPLVCSENLMFTGDHGMGSGSGGTNFDECNAHGCMQHEVAMVHGKRLNRYSNAYGDDGILSYPGIDVEHVIECYSSHGQVLNPDKQTADKHSAVYLRRYFHDSYRDEEGIMLGIYSTERALGRLMGQERFIRFDKSSMDYKRYVVLRALSILENCNNHPLFYQFVDFVIKGDKYRLGLSIPGFFDSLDKQVKEAMAVDSNVLGYTQQLQKQYAGINSWKVVKYLRSKL